MREELATIAPRRQCDRLAELSALFHAAGSLHLRSGGDWGLHLDVGSGFAGIEHLKFQRTMIPGTRATLALAYAEGAGKLDFSFASADARFSSGRLLVRGSS